MASFLHGRQTDLHHARMRAHLRWQIKAGFLLIRQVDLVPWCMFCVKKNGPMPSVLSIPLIELKKLPVAMLRHVCVLVKNIVLTNPMKANANRCQMVQ